MNSFLVHDLSFYFVFCSSSVSQNSNLKSVKDSWVIESKDNVTVLATANGSKTIETLLTEANTALQSMSIEANHAIELKQIVVPTGDGTTAQTSLDTYIGSQILVTNMASINLRADKWMHINENILAHYTLYLPSKYLSGYTLNLTTSAITENELPSRKPSNGTTLYIRYNLWKKV